MKIKDIYGLAVKMGMEKDPRGRAEIRRILAGNRERYESLPPKDKEFFDLESLENPFADTRILAGDPEAEAKAVLVGIDMEVGEVLLADRLRESGRPVDLVISHHPEGGALAALNEVMALQADLWHSHGVPINVGDALIGKRMAEIQRAFLPRNHQRALDAARLLGIPFMCIHTPADNQVNAYLSDFFARRKPRLLKDVVEQLRTIPEYRAASLNRCGPTIIAGSPDSRAGRIMVDMTGGTEGPQQVLERLSQAGVGTIVCMHYSEKHREEAEKYQVNVVVAGHISSDSLGLNLVLDELEKKGVEIIPASGLIRVSRMPAKGRTASARGKGKAGGK
jgi:putative NIF3 family GTP cyclohydrolase 1 type 2